MGFLKRSLMVGAAVAAMMFSGCTPQTSGKSSASGSLALSSDDALLYAVDTDNGILAVVDTATNTKVAEVKVGKSPVRVVVGADDTIYVSNRGDRSVSVVRRGEWTEAAKIATGVEPNGIAVSPDARTLYVVSSTAIDDPEVGTVMAVDTATMQPKWETRVGNEPRAIGLVSGNRALVTQYKTGQVVEVDLGTGDIKNQPAQDAVYRQANLTRVNEGAPVGSTGGISSFRPRALNDVAVSPDGNRTYLPTVWAREDAITRRPNSAGGYYSAGGPCNVGSVATAGIVTVNTQGAPDPQVDDLTACSSTGINNSDVDFPPSVISAGNVSAAGPVQGPSVAVVDATGEWLYVVNKETNNLAVMPTGRRVSANGEDIDFQSTGSSVRSLAVLGNGADGIALTKDGLTAYTYSQFDHTIQRIYAANPETMQPARGPNSQLVTDKLQLQVATDILTAEQVQGRKMFFDAHDDTISSSTTVVACSTCHLEGREDAHVWSFPDGKRQTPSLAGRGLSQTAPFHWSGEFDTINQFMSHTVRERMGGKGLSNNETVQMMAWLDSETLPETTRLQTATAEQERGAAVFQKAQCGTCHNGEFLTNNLFADVGTRLSTDTGVEKGFNVPSLRGIGRTSPYLHDGSARTLRERLDSNPGDKHGMTSTLTDGEKSDLVAYLKTL